MKKIFCFLIALFVLSCASDEEVAVDVKSVKKVQVEVEPLQQGILGSRTLGEIYYDEVTEGNYAEMYFAGNEKLAVYPSVGRAIDFSCTEKLSKYSVVFEAEAWALKEGYTYSAFYPCSEEIMNNYNATSIPFSYEGQSITGYRSGWDVIDYISSFDYMYSSAIVPKNGRCSFKLNRIGSLLVFAVPLEAGKKYTKFEIEADENIFVQSGKLNILTGAITDKVYSNKMAVDFNNVVTDPSNSYPVMAVGVMMSAPVYIPQNTTVKVYRDDNIVCKYKTSNYCEFTAANQGLVVLAELVEKVSVEAINPDFEGGPTEGGF